MTSDLERERLQAGYGQFESQERDKVVSFGLAVKAVLFIYISLWSCMETFSSSLPRRPSIGDCYLNPTDSFDVRFEAP
jgi:hypothetical protein